MNFNTANQTFRQLMGNGLTCKVPAFQRDYCWTEDEWDDHKIAMPQRHLADVAASVWRIDFGN